MTRNEIFKGWIETNCIRVQQDTYGKIDQMVAIYSNDLEMIPDVDLKKTLIEATKRCGLTSRIPNVAEIKHQFKVLSGRLDSKCTEPRYGSPNFTKEQQHAIDAANEWFVSDDEDKELNPTIIHGINLVIGDAPIMCQKSSKEFWEKKTGVELDPIITRPERVYGVR